MTTVHITTDPLSGTHARVAFPYNPELVDLLKLAVPSYGRHWNPAAKVWTISSLHVGDFISYARRAGHHVMDLRGDGGQKRRTDHDHYGSSATPHGWAESLLAAVGPEREDAVFKALTRVLHPDTATGSTELMQQLNRARDARRKAAA